MKSSFEDRLRAIEIRNERVEADKAWETSVLRKVLITLTTFALIGLYLSWLNVSKPWLNAVVPVIGFLLSTLAVQKSKEIWLKVRK